jgi:hypothetical protein
MNSKILQKRVRGYNNYLQYLVSNNILECDNQYISGEISREYRFTLPYQTFNKEVVITKYTLVKNLKPFYLPKMKPGGRYHYLTKWFNVDLTIDYSAADDYLYLEYLANCNAGIAFPEYRYNITNCNAIRLRDHDFYYHVDSTVNRFHSNLTSSKKCLRNFISYGGSGLVAIDIKNCQPWLSTLMFNPAFYEKRKRSSSSLFTLYSLLNSSSSSSYLTSPSIMLVKNELLLRGRGKDDIDMYCQKVDDGTLYEYLQTS